MTAHNSKPRRPVIGILRGVSRQDIEGVVPAVIRAGLDRLEITMNTPGATALIELARSLAEGALEVGAGTVLNEEQLDAALEAGATFVVTPVVNERVIRRCVDAAIPVYPGAFSPTEIVRAWELGASMVKLFPADQLGPQYVRNLKGPLPHIPLLPTGGVTLSSMKDWITAGADGFGVGGPLFDRERMAAGDWGWIEAQCRQFVELACWNVDVPVRVPGGPRKEWT